MNKLRISILFLMLVLLCGCTGSYNLKISDDKFVEEINFDMSNKEYNVYPFDNFEQYPFYNNSEKVYDVKVVDNGGSKYVTLSYTYTPKNFSQSNALKFCFSKHDYIISDKYYDIQLEGPFNCMNDNDSFDINIITKNKVISNNADSVSGSTYTWHVTSANRNNLSVKIKIKKGTGFSFDIVMGIVLVIVVVSIGFIVAKIFINKKNAQDEF